MTDTSRSAADRATVLCDLQRYDEALSLLAPALAADPEDPRLHCLAARAHLGSGDVQRGLDHARTAAALDPDSDWPHRLLSLAEMQRENYQAAVRAAREAVRLAPYLPETHIQLAYALLELPWGNAEATDAATKALELAPDDPDAHLVAGAVAAAGQRKDEAEAQFNRVLSLDPDNTAAHNELARLHLKKRNIGNPGGLGQAAAGFATAVAADGVLLWVHRSAQESAVA